MTRIHRTVVAFCMLAAGILYPAVEACAFEHGENFAGYQRIQIMWGATALTLPAQLEYRAAQMEIQRGNYDEAVQHLQSATRLAPDYPDPYFTMAAINLRRLQPDALYNTASAFRAIWRNFHAQSQLALNAALMLVLMFVMVSMIVLIAFAIRYLPFVAYRVSEILQQRFNAALPRAAALFLVLIPFLPFPGFIVSFSLLIVMTWPFLQKREKAVMVALALPFVALSALTIPAQRFAPIADPSSFVSQASTAATAAGDADLILSVSATEAKGLEVEKNNVLGILQLRQENYDIAADHFLRAISLRPEDPVAYINLGNAYYEQGQYEKALEGYRKAERLAPADAVGQYNLAQAYIKTLLLAESSKALKNASTAGINRVRSSMAADARPTVQIFDRTYSNADLWRIAGTEGANTPGSVLADVLKPVTHVPVQSAGWVLLGAIAVALVLSRSVKRRHLAFQCSNCGVLTSEASGGDERGVFTCGPCAAAIAGVSSDKVIEALLRQRRQSVLVKRRKSIRAATMWIPGIRDLFYGRIARGLALATLFSFSLLQLWTRGYLIRDPLSLSLPLATWKLVVPAAGMGIAYALSLSSTKYKEVRNRRSSLGHTRLAREESASARPASA